MNRSALGLIVAAVAISVAVTIVRPAAAHSAKPCGTLSGPQARVGKTSFSHYGVAAINADCGSARRTVASILTKHLPNSVTPLRTKSPTGWICVAEEVDRHVAIAGHCQRGRSSAISWVGAGLHP